MNNKDADQTAQMCRLICPFVIYTMLHAFSWCGLYIWYLLYRIKPNVISYRWAGPWENVLCHMRTTKAQISLRIRAVWSAPLLFAAYNISRFYSRNFKTLASFCGCAGRFVSGLVRNSRRHVLSCRGSGIMKIIVTSMQHGQFLQGFAWRSELLVWDIQCFDKWMWATTWQNVSSGVSDQARHKPACAATEAS